MIVQEFLAVSELTGPHGSLNIRVVRAEIHASDVAWDRAWNFTVENLVPFAMDRTEVPLFNELLVYCLPLSGRVSIGTSNVMDPKKYICYGTTILDFRDVSGAIRDAVMTGGDSQKMVKDALDAMKSGLMRAIERSPEPRLSGMALTFIDQGLYGVPWRVDCSFSADGVPYEIA